MIMRKLALSLSFLLVALNAFGHAGEVHTYMGTVAAVREDGSFALDKTDGTSMDVTVAKATVFRHADGKFAKRTELAPGRRVVVTIAEDGRTATTIKFAAKKKD